MRIAVVIVLAACGGKTTSVATVCGTSPHDTTCTGTLNIIEGKEADFRIAAREAIDAVFDPRFEQDLERFMTNHAGDADIAAAWSGLKASEITTQLRAAVVGVQIETKGGIRARLARTFYGTVAKEGGPAGGPIEVNEYSARHMTPPELANTIVHEVGHAIGLGHPHMGGPSRKNWTTAMCEPPYLIGSLVQRIASPQPLSGQGHCARL